MDSMGIYILSRKKKSKVIIHNKKYKEVFYNGAWESDNLEHILIDRDIYKYFAAQYHSDVCDCGDVELHVSPTRERMRNDAVRKSSF